MVGGGAAQAPGATVPAIVDNYRSVMRRCVFVALLLVGIVGVGCSSTDDTTSPDDTTSTGTLTGTFAAVGGPSPGVHETLSGTVTITEVASERQGPSVGFTEHEFLEHATPPVCS